MDISGRFSFETYVEAARSALATGRDLMEEYLDWEREGLSLFPLVPPKASLHAMEAYFTNRRNGESAMGCLQIARFPAPTGSRFPIMPLAEAPNVYRDHCRYQRPNGRIGGFTYTPVIRKRLGAGEPEPAHANDLDFTLPGLEWLVVRVDIHDFVLGIPLLRPFAGPTSRFVKEAALLLVHRDFGRTLLPPASDLREQSLFGYSFLPLAPEPNPFGFGPGNFGAAVKRFRFMLRADGGLDIELMFTVSPRSRMILNLNGRDPVYGAIHWLDRITGEILGLGRRAHDRFDRVMLSIHGRVHHRLLDDISPAWENRIWTA